MGTYCTPPETIMGARGPVSFRAETMSTPDSMESFHKHHATPSLLGGHTADGDPTVRAEHKDTGKAKNMERAAVFRWQVAGGEHGKEAVQLNPHVPPRQNSPKLFFPTKGANE